MRILFADSNHSVLHETLQAAGHICDLFWDQPADILKQILPQYDALVIRSKFKINKILIDQCPTLKCIGRVGAGMENIDLDYALSKNVVCVSAPEGNRDAVGEHALGMLLMLLNKLKKADNEVREGVWLRAENRGFEITGKTIGILGYGHMGSSFAQKLSGFDCTILAYDKYKTAYGNAFVKESTLEQIFETCDILCIHLPLTAETEYLVDRHFINSFKKNIYLINTARGKCLNTTDLVEALKSGKIAGACLDVLEYEKTSFEALDPTIMPEPFKFLIQSNQVMLSPHIAGWTHESNFKMSKIIAEKMIEAFQTI